MTAVGRAGDGVVDVVIAARGLRKDFTLSRSVSRFRRQRYTLPAVDGVDLTVRRGELLGYLGPNGAGKSTTLKMFTGILMPSSGELSVCGLVPVKQRRRLAARIGVVFGQRTQLWWDLPLRDSFDLARHIWQVPASDHSRRLARFRADLDLDSFMDTPVRQLSLGQRMRAELTVALLHGPAVLFLDEPTIGLDVVSKQAVRAFLAELRDRGDTTIVLTTHDLADVERLCQRIVVIDHGRIVQDGSLASLHERYGSRRRVAVSLEEPLPEPVQLPGVVIESSSMDGRQLTFGLDGSGLTAGELVARLASVGSLRDISVQEPDIEEVIARLYSRDTVDPPATLDPPPPATAGTVDEKAIDAARSHG